MLEEDAIKKVLAGESAMGTFEQYFLDTPSFNKKHGIEDEGYGQANGYGTVSMQRAINWIPQIVEPPHLVSD